MKITIQATNMELTDAIRAHAEKKIMSVEKFFDNIVQADIDVGMRSHRHQKGKIYYAEVNLHVPGTIVRVAKDAEDLYKAIDKVKDHLKVELEKLKGKLRSKDRETLRNIKGYDI